MRIAHATSTWLASRIRTGAPKRGHRDRRQHGTDASSPQTEPIDRVNVGLERP